MTTHEIVTSGIFATATFIFSAIKESRGGSFSWGSLASNAPLWIAALCLFLCYFTCKAVYHLYSQDVEAWKQYMPIIYGDDRLPRRPAAWKWWLGAIITCGFFISFSLLAGMFILRSSPASSKIEGNPVPRLYLGCNIVGLPVPLTVGEAFNILHVPSEIGGMSHMVPNSTGTYSFGVEKPGGVIVHRCQVTNDSPFPVHQISIALKVTKRRIVRGTDGLTTPGGVKITASGGGNGKMMLSGDPVGSLMQDLDIDRIGASGDSFRFYIWNWTNEYFVEVTPQRDIKLSINETETIGHLVNSDRLILILHPTPVKDSDDTRK